MGLFDFFKKKNVQKQTELVDSLTNLYVEKQARGKIRQGFDESVSNAVNELSDPLFKGLQAKAAIVNFYQTMKLDYSLQQGLKKYGIDYQKMLEEECLNALKKYLKGDLYKL